MLWVGVCLSGIPEGREQEKYVGRRVEAQLAFSLRGVKRFPLDAALKPLCRAN